MKILALETSTEYCSVALWQGGEVTQRMLRLLLSRVRHGFFGRPRVVLCVPSAITEVERRAVAEATDLPVMLYDEALAHRMADALLDEGVYVIGFSYPVVPKGKARIRVQVSAAHTDDQLDRAVDAFTRVGTRMGVISA